MKSESEHHHDSEERSTASRGDLFLLGLFLAWMLSAGWLFLEALAFFGLR